MPHAMKKLLFFFSLLLVFVSCKLKGEAESTPQLSFSVFEHHHDSIVRYFDARPLSSGLYLIDTIAVLDTMAFYIGANGVYNGLDSLIVRWDSTAMKATFAVGSDWSNYIDASKSDIPKGRFHFYPYVQSILVPMVYVPTKPGTDTLSFHLANTSTVFGPVQVTFIQPVR